MEGKAIKNVMLCISLLLALFMTMPLQAQTISQKGVTYRYNGKNNRTPIGGVYIKPITAANGVVSDESSGTFTLALDNLKMGSRIGNVRVTKQGMMVFNQQAVDEWSVRKDPLYLILCDADEFQKQKKNLIAIGESQAKKKYDQKLTELKKQNDAKQLKIDEYYNKLDSLEKEYQNALKHMDEYADMFARIDESEVDTVAQRAIEMFNRGEIEESIHLLEQQNYMEKIKQANRTIEQADAMITTAEQAKSLAEQDKQKYLEGIKTQIAGYKLQNEWDKAKEFLKGLADNLNTLEAIWEYAMFCHEQVDFNDAEQYELKYINILHSSTEIDEINKMALLSIAQISLASLYNATQRFSESETIYKTALDNCEQLEKAQSFAFEPLLASTRMFLAVLYHDTLRYPESETMYKAALEIYEQLAKTDSSAFESNLALTQNFLGTLYRETQRYPESETMYKNALETYERLAKANPSAFEPSLASTNMNLAGLYYDIQCYPESEAMYKAALKIQEQLAKRNPSAFEYSLALIQRGLADLYRENQRYSESEAMYKAALKIQEKLAKANPSAFDPDLVLTQRNLALFYSDTQRFQESETMYKAAIEIYKRLAKGSPLIYKIGLAECYYWLGRTMLLMKKHNAATDSFKQSLNLGRQIANTGEYTRCYWQSLFDLSAISVNEKQYASAYKYNEELVLILKDYYKDDTDRWKSDYARELVNKAFLSILLCKFKEGELYTLEALKVDSTLHMAYTNLAAALLFQGKVEEAEKLYRQYKAELKDGFLSDFAEFERLGIIPEERKKDVERIRTMLKEE